MFSLFCVFGFPSCVHNDRGSPFVSQETRTYLSARGISFSTSTAYHPTGNSQCERFNQTIWRTIQLLLHGRGLPEDRWKEVLAEVFNAVRSLVCLSTNETPHERLFRFSSRSMNGMALPSWLLTPGTVLLRRHVRRKGDPFCDPVELVEGNPTYSVVRLPDGKESTVSTSDLAPYSPSLPTKARTRRKLSVLAALTCEMRQWMKLLTTYDVKWKVTRTLFQRKLTVNRFCSAGLPADANPLIVMVLMSLSLVSTS